MCRMLLAVGAVNVGVLIDGMVAMAKDTTQVHELNRESGLGTWTHLDGWGMAYLQDGHWKIHKSTQPIPGDPLLAQLRDVKTDLVIIHARYGSMGSTALENTHPFTASLEEQQLVFCHNGTIREVITHLPQFQPQGSTDSEQLFFKILSNHIDGTPVHEAIRNCFESLATVDSNVILSTRDRSYVAVNFSKYPKYLQMHLARREGVSIISSEPLDTGVWSPLAHRSVVEIEHASKQVSIHSALEAK